MYNWITKYFPNQPSSAEGGEVATNEKAEIPKDRLESKDKFEIVIDTAKMNEQWTKLNELEKEMIKQKRTTRKRSDQNKWAKSDLFEWAGTYRQA